MVYEKFFYLKENPFNITPDPKFLYLSKKHQEALDLISFGISERKGFILLSGEVGTGKTTICRTILNKLDPKIRSAFIINPFISDIELLMAINEDLGLKVDSPSLKEHLNVLNSFLLERTAEGGNVVVVIDEAQNLSLKALEMIRVLSNLETEKMKLLQIVLAGQPELREKLQLPELSQLNQRVAVRCHLGPLDFEETKGYIFNRLTIAGGKGNIKFITTVLRSIYETSSGIPRLINIVCDRVLTAAFVVGKRIIDEDVVKKAIDDLDKDGVIRKKAVRVLSKNIWQKYKYIPYFFVAAILVLILIGWWNVKKTAISLVDPINSAPPVLDKIIKDTVPSASDSPIKNPSPIEQNVTAEISDENNSTTLSSPNTSIPDLNISGTDIKPDSRLSLSPQAVSGEHAGMTDLKGFSGQPIIKYGELFKGIIILVNDIKHTVANGDVLEVNKGDRLEIVDVIAEDIINEDLSVNLLGFVGNTSDNTGEDRGYIIDTAKDMWINYSINKQGIEYPIVVKYAGEKVGEVFIKINKK